MKRLLKTMWRHKIPTILLGVPACFVLLVGIVVAEVATGNRPQPVSSQNPQSACTLDSQTFLKTVNEWRTEKGVSPLAYSSVLQAAATDHMNDMIKYSYYGHTNPVTKVVWYEQIYKQYASSAHHTAEVLSGDASSTQELTDLKNSPEHYDALTSADYKYFGSYAVYSPQSWAIYDNSGNETDPAGKYHTNCLVLGELSDSDEQADASSSSEAASGSQSDADAIAKANVEDMHYKQEMNCISIDESLAKSLEQNIDDASKQAYAQRDQIQSQRLSTDDTNKEIAKVYAEYNGYIESYYNNYISTDKGYGCTPTYPSDLPLLIAPTSN